MTLKVRFGPYRDLSLKINLVCSFFRISDHSDQPLSFSGTYFHKSSLYGSLSFFFPFMIESTMVCRAYMKFLSREKYEFLLFECLSIYNWHLDCWQSKKGQLSCLLYCWCCLFCVKDNICNIWEVSVYLPKIIINLMGYSSCTMFI